MKFTRLLVLLLVALVIVTFAIFLRQKRQSSLAWGQLQTGQKIFSDLDLNSLTKVQVQRLGQTLTLLKINGVWQVEEKYGYPATFSLLRDFLTKVAEAKVVQNVPANADQWSQLDLVSPENQGAAIEIKLFKDSNQLATLFYVGKNPANASGRYVRLPQKNESIFLVNEPFSALNYKLEDWLDKQFIRPDKIASVTIKPTAKEEWKLFRSSETNAFEMAGVKKEKLDSEKVDSLIQTLSSLRFDDILETNLVKEGFSDPSYVEIATLNEKSYRLTVGSVTNEHYFVKLNVGDKQQDQKHFEKYIYLIPKSSLNPLLGDPLFKK
ncbi:MAG: DUF4340 domain-containing protein [Verrucomicrobiae bacterium]|nr:DUF4340 domain-containing protein [Verrucomicrobiae bacterium]